MTIMILLVGEQPAPNILPIHYYHPEQIVLVYTDHTQNRAGRLETVIANQTKIHLLKTSAYQMDEIKCALKTCIIDEHGWCGNDLLFNLTGGTKIMSLAAYEVARQISARAFYYQSEQNKSLILPYVFDVNGNLFCEMPFTLDTALSVEEFLHLYVDHYSIGKYCNDFERGVADVLQSLGSEYEFLNNVALTGVSGNVEIDFILRYRNMLMVCEVKSHATKNDDIDQLNGVTDQRTLGTYTKKLLISADELHQNDKDLVDAYNIHTVTLPSGREKNLSLTDKNILIQAIRKVMEPHL